MPRAKPSSFFAVNNSNRRPFIIPVFLPHCGCPHHCVFCNQHAVTNIKQNLLSPEGVDTAIKKFVSYKGKRRGQTQIAFFGGNFLGLEPQDIIAFLSVATRYVRDGRVDGIRFSTRPDTITHAKMDLIAPFPVQTIELGVQSMNARVLRLSGRGHTRTETIAAVNLLHERGYQIGLQLMIGLPGDEEHISYDTGRKVAELEPDFVRIYPALVLKGSRMAQWFQTGKFKPLPLDKCVTRVKNLYLYFNRHAIAVVRMGLQATEGFSQNKEILSGPYHPAFGHLVHSELFRDMAQITLKTGDINRASVMILVHPRSISKMRGLKNNNIRILQSNFGIRSLQVRPETSLALDGMRLAGAGSAMTYADLKSEVTKDNELNQPQL
jgi:histone acetyltransferase (RNA polymerase elongator complex component)